ncbi:MAG TPA: Sec-independent protein translocase protein TatB [Steroidobacteraceae bacterium]
MFDVGFSEVLLIFVIALVVLGPEKLPRLASQVGRWLGRARAMARQFREQLEEEVNLEEVRKAHQKAQKPTGPQGDTASAQGATSPGQSAYDSSASTPPYGAKPTDSGTSQAGTTPYQGPDPADFRADTFSHAHPTNEYGANPYTSTGAAEEPPPAPTPGTPDALEPSSAHVSPAQSQFSFDTQTPSEANVAAAQPGAALQAEQRVPADEAYAARRSRDNTPGTDNHGN